MKVTIKGQVTIPADMRRRYGIGKNTEVRFTPTKKGILLTPAESREEKFLAALGRARGSATTGLTTDEIMKMTRGED